ncbi:MAG: tetratricopeptide repeat protein [Candidatus Omnitrophica bacterium]|nr:tetratricopeptide repeat protein [Candidatus Omnitrophota bacterium]
MRAARTGWMIALIMWALAACATGWANGSQEAFDQANALYAQGRYEEAVKIYETLIKDGSSDGAVYYNLGNAYFKLNHKGKALLYYERAARLLPNDEDISHNLSHVTSLVEQEAAPDGGGWWVRWARDIRNVLRAEGWFWVLLGAYLAGIAVLALGMLRVFSGDGARWSAVSLAVLGLVAALFFGWHKSDESQGRPAIVIADPAVVRYSPSYDGALAFEAAEGLKVKAIREEGGWLQVRTGPGQGGWTEPGAVEVV